MSFRSINDFLQRARGVLAQGPVALIFVEDEVEIASTLDHHRRIGFRNILLFMPDEFVLAGLIGGPEAGVQRISYNTHARHAVPTAVNAVLAATPATTWLYWGYNAEYLFYPFCESRSITEMLAFHAEERRGAMLSYVVDLYAGDLEKSPNAVNLDAAMFDRTGYYAMDRFSADGLKLERQVDVFGGIRWRFEDHIPWARRRIDRVALFRPKKGLTLREDFTFSDEEMNTAACPWHHNLTAAVASFRAAKALRTNPGSKWAIPTFEWRGSERFTWSSRQLLEMGFIEPGQWF